MKRRDTCIQRSSSFASESEKIGIRGHISNPALSISDQLEHHIKNTISAIEWNRCDIQVQIWKVLCDWCISMSLVLKQYGIREDDHGAE